MAVAEYFPSDVLKPFVNLITVVESTEGGTYKVLPGTGLVMGFQFRGKISQVLEATTSSLNSSGITGLHDSVRIFKSTENTGSVLVYFKEGGSSAFFREPMNEIFKKSESLDNFMLRSELLVFEEQLCEAKTDKKRVSIVEHFLISRLRIPGLDNLVMTAVALILKSSGTIRIADLANQLHISQAPLEKRFRKVIGASPKKFASIVRMKSAISNYNPTQSLTELGYNAGFYDQAHFIKEFKSFTGDTPQAFFKKS